MLDRFVSLVFVGILVSFSALCANSQSEVDQALERIPGWKTNVSKRSIDLKEVRSGGPPKDGIPALDKPKFISISEARSWLGPKEPVIALEIGGKARAYPLQILIWHEIINHDFDGTPVSVTFCPLCYSAIAFDRRLDGKTYNFGVSGMLRHSDMVMFDRETESWWQQITGEAIVGDLTGMKLKQIPAQIVGFEQFAEAYPKGLVVSKETGYKRDYGRNPYVGYDNVNQKPYFPVGKDEGRLRPMEKVIVVEVDGQSKVYPYSVSRKKRVINDRVESKNLVIFHNEGVNSALDQSTIEESRDVGATGVFVREIDGEKLEFTFKERAFFDNKTNSRWNVLGQAVEGRLKGKQLTRFQHGDYFAFAWLTFRPKSIIYVGKN